MRLDFVRFDIISDAEFHPNIPDYVNQTMPIYEYECTACAHNFETMQRMSDAPLADCPACAAPKLRKKLSASAFHLKGSGWYQTDFKGGKKAPAGESESGEAGQVADSKADPKDAKEAKGEPKKAAEGSSQSKESNSDTKSISPRASSSDGD